METPYITIDTLTRITGGNICTNSTLRIIDPVGFGTPVYHTNNPNDTTSYTITYYNIDTLQCQDRCNWLYGLRDDGFYGKKAIQYDIESKLNYGNDIINIKIKINNDYMDFVIESEIKSDNMVITVNNLQGQVLTSNRFNLLKGDNFFQLPINNLITGLYFINVTIDGIVHKSEKIILIK